MTHTVNDDLNWAHPLIKKWFHLNVGNPTEPQTQGWPSILAGADTLISAPTGSGKTFAAFLICINELVKKSLTGTLLDQTDVIYVSPLKALSNDIHKNLTGPLKQIMTLAEKSELTMSDIRVAVRTGDTLAKERQSMLKKPPHILVTTPESLYILLTAEKSRNMLKNVKTLIIDEIHVLVNDKRGAHLALSIERLKALTQKKLLRIGLSATQKPIELVGQFLVGSYCKPPTLINIGYAKQLELAIEVPASELGAVASNEMWDEIYARLASIASAHRSTLIFVNTRRLAERIAHHLSERLGEDKVLAHHGSLSRKLRFAAEQQLKQGELTALVATASLELGIDIGTIDVVCQIGSPRAIATALQRIGRSGHWHKAVSKGKFFVTTRDELIECAALIHAIRKENLDQLILPNEPLDILAQQIVAICVTGEWQTEKLFQLVKAAFPFKDLTRVTFDAIISMLANGIAGSRGRYGAYLFHDQVNEVVSARRHARITSILNGGAIPDNGLFTVIAEPTGMMVGTLDEDFAVESNRGDIILLGTTSWQIRRIEAGTGRVLVEDAHGAPPSVPFWRGEAPSRTDELSLAVSDLRCKMDDLIDKNAEQANQWLQQHCGLNASGAEQLIEYVKEGKKILGAIPTQQTIIAERFFDESGGMQLVIHAPFGARINKAWGLALRKRFCHSFNFELQAAATDNGLTISLAEQHSFPLSDVFHYLHPATLKNILIQAVLQSPLFPTRWRWVAVRSLALPKFQGGKKLPPNILRMRADDLLAAVFPDAAACQDNLAGRDIIPPDHPLINEAMKDALHEALDVEGVTRLIAAIVDGKITCLAVDTPVASVFSHELLNANPYAFLDDAPLEERRARAVEMRRMLPESVLEEIGKLDPQAIKLIKEQAWPDVRNADELHDFLQTIIALPKTLNNWESFTIDLITQGRVGVANYNNHWFYIAAEKLKTFLAIYPSATLEQTLKEIEINFPERQDAILQMLRGWLFHLGPITNNELVTILQLDPTEIDQALYRLESTGTILRGQFRFSADESLEWCERRLLARVHKETIGRLRREIAPVSPAQFMYWLLTWQHLIDNPVRDEHGLLEIIKQLQGFEIPANAWESQIFAKRIVNYQASMLDNLCLRGLIGWGRLSSPFTESDTVNKRIVPTSVAPITFFVREESDWMSFSQSLKNRAQLSSIAKNIYDYLKQYGASFFVDIVKGVNHLKSEVETGLWELVTAGLVTADSFDNMRSLIDPKRRLGRMGRRRVKSYSSGRWTLLRIHDVREQSNNLSQIESLCFVLLKRYGVVFRDILAREKNLPSWRELLITFRRLEDRGEIRGGRFVDGFLGEQFALPIALESLRLIRKKSAINIELSISAVDPLNLYGIILPGQRMTAASGKSIDLKLVI